MAFKVYKTVILEKYGTENRIGRITLNRPEKLNALSRELLRELDEALSEAVADQDIRVIVLRGAGRTFSTGYDLADPEPFIDFGPGGPRQPGEKGWAQGMVEMEDRLTRRALFIWDLPKVTIAQLHGYCLAGGLELASACDILIASEDCLIGHPGARSIGHPTASCFWPWTVSMRHAKWLAYTGDQVTGKQAAEINMINKAVPADKLEEEVDRSAERIAIESADTLRMHKACLNIAYRAMGIEAAIQARKLAGIVWTLTDTPIEFFRRIEEGGLKSALDWRDKPYGDLRGGKKSSG